MSRILDYGCGGGRLARKLLDRGHEVIGYEPDSMRAPRLASRGVRTIPAPAGGPYDVVICELVLCTIEDGPVYDAVLHDLRRLVSQDGRVIVAVCNPSFTLGGDTPLQHREIPRGAAPERVFTWTKTLHTGARRLDVHRPLERLKHDFVSAGLAIETIRETSTVDVERFEPSSDFMVFRLRPLPIDALSIKTEERRSS